MLTKNYKVALDMLPLILGITYVVSCLAVNKSAICSPEFVHYSGSYDYEIFF